jgi:ribosomal protein L1
MRELDEEERTVLRQLDGDVATPDLILIVRDLGEVLRDRGLVIQANVAELAADRLEYLSTGRRRWQLRSHEKARFYQSNAGKSSTPPASQSNRI